MASEKKLDLITRNTQEILTIDELRKKFEIKKSLISYYGTAPTGLYHMGYLVPLSKLFDFHKAGIRNKVLIANIHAALDDLKTPWEQIDGAGDYYQKCIQLSYPWDEQPTFVRGSTFQLTKDYQLDLLKLATLSTISRTTRAASEVTRMKNPKVSELIYPLMQALDEEYLDVDIQLGGIDQRHIFAYAREYLPKINYEPRVEIMTPLIVSLKGPGVKMSASLPETCILVHESESVLTKNIEKAYCPAGTIQDNPILQLLKFIVFSVKDSFPIERDKKFGGDITYQDYAAVEKDFADKKLHPSDLKTALIHELTFIFKKVRQHFEKHPDEIPSRS